MRFHCGEAEARRRAGAIRVLGLDVDGVLSDGRLYFSSAGEEIKAFHALDGHGVKMLLGAGLRVCILTSRSSPILQRRCADLGITDLYQGVEDKLASGRDFLAGAGLAMEQFCFVGDDLMDLPLLLAAGLSCSVPNAHEDVRDRVHLLASKPGGRGAVREITDFLLRSRGLYEQVAFPQN